MNLRYIFLDRTNFQILILQHINNMLKDKSSISKIIFLLFLCLHTYHSRKGRQLSITLVTAFWVDQIDKVDVLSDTSKLLMFKQLINTDQNMIIFGDLYTMEIVKQQRNQSNTVFVLKTIQQINELSTSKMVNQHLQNLKKDHLNVYNKYENQSQFNSKDKASIMYSKIHLLKESLSYDIFQTDYIYWIQPDIYLMPDYKFQNFFYKQHNILRQFSLSLQLPFIIRSGNVSNIGVFKQSGAHYGSNIGTFASTQWFGGKVQTISSVASIYQNILKITLANGDYWKIQSVLTLMVHRYPKIVTQINNLIPRGFYTFEINPFMERRIQQKRHILVSSTINSTLKFKQKNHPQIPIYKTQYRTNESFFQFELLLQKAKFRVKRSEVFLSGIILAYIIIKISKTFFNISQRKQRTVRLGSQQMGSV